MKGIILRGLKQGVSVSWTLGKIVFPVTILVTILRYTPVLPWIIDFLTPLMKVIGLPGEAAMPLVLGNALNLYAGIGAIVSFDFTVKEVFILAIMLSFSHNLFIESTVAAKVGVNWWLISGIRVGLALISAFFVNLVWSGGSDPAQYGFIASSEVELTTWTAIGFQGFKTAVIAVLQLSAVIFPLMLFMQFMRESGWLDALSKGFAPFTKFLGMKENTSFTLVTGLTIGLAFGAGVMIQAVKEDGVSKKDMILALIFLVTCHAVIEDTVIFIPLGIPVWPLLVIRFMMAVIITMIVAFIWNRAENRRRSRLKYEY
ncbi:MAG TPA: nucleoside recognition domain-containing protein [Pseudogracilibacillus sp.]|nr:nucleoside recognition domain-containing protein [Pseudogracilibacillus sp.]